MAALFRMNCARGLRQGLALLAPKKTICRGIAATPQQRDNACKEQTRVVKKKWVSFGFDYEDETQDRHIMHLTFFVTITICLVLGTTVFAYLPDPKFKDWARREAYLRLRYREEHNLPLIDPNLIDPSKIKLPSDEELSDTEIII